MTQVDDAFLLNLLQTIGEGVAVVDPDSLEIVFENGRFFEWFSPNEDVEDSIAARLPQLDLERASERIERRGAYAFEAEAGEGARQVSLSGDVRECELAGCRYLVVELHDVTKQREAEYLLDSYSKMVERHTRDLEREKERVEKLLLNIMPRAVYEEMRDSGFTTPQRFDEATMLMLDFVGFTDMANSRDPTGLITELNDIFTVFDRIVEHFGCDRMKTIGDAYMAVSGLPEPNADHAEALARVAIRMRKYIEKRNATHAEQWHCRIGLHSGPRDRVDRRCPKVRLRRVRARGQHGSADGGACRADADPRQRGHARAHPGRLRVLRRRRARGQGVRDAARLRPQGEGVPARR